MPHPFFRWIVAILLLTGLPLIAAESIAELEAQAATSEAAKFKLAVAYYKGLGVNMDHTRAFELFAGASPNANFPEAKYNLAVMYARGEGTSRDESTAMALLREVQIDAAARKPATARRATDALRLLEQRAIQTPSQPVTIQEPLVDNSGPSTPGPQDPPPRSESDSPPTPEPFEDPASPIEESRLEESPDYPVPAVPANYRPVGSGSGFFISEDGFFVTNQHVTKGNPFLVIKAGQNYLPAALVTEDQRNDIAILKVKGRFRALPLQTSPASVAQRVFTYGFPDPQYQGYAPKFTDGSISSLSGENDDPTAYQITVPVQHGNSGGPLVDFYGNVVGVVVRIKVEMKPLKLAKDKDGELVYPNYAPQNVNYAVKAKMILAAIDTIPNLAKRLPKLRPTTKERNQSEVAAEVEQAIGQVFSLGPR